jgi:hypothetical protein
MKAAVAMTAVAAHPKTKTGWVTVKRPIWLGWLATHIIAAMIGTATKPLITALQNRALIGSIGRIRCRGPA